MPRWISEKSEELFGKHGIFTKEELASRYEIVLENYAKAVHIESLTMQEMVRKDFTQGMLAYMKDLAEEASLKKGVLPGAGCWLESRRIEELDQKAAQMMRALEQLESDTEAAEKEGDILERALFYERKVLADMGELREIVDGAERMIPDSYLPYPTYSRLLFSLR